MKRSGTSTRVAVGRGVHRARNWAAPQVDRIAKALQDKLAPPVSATLSSAPQRIEPAKPQRRRWRRLACIAILAAVASALAALVRNRAKPGLAPWPGTNPDDIAPAAQVRDENARASTDSQVDRAVRTS